MSNKFLKDSFYTAQDLKVEKAILESNAAFEFNTMGLMLTEDPDVKKTLSGRAKEFGQGAKAAYGVAKEKAIEFLRKIKDWFMNIIKTIKEFVQIVLLKAQSKLDEHFKEYKSKISGKSAKAQVKVTFNYDYRGVETYANTIFKAIRSNEYLEDNDLSDVIKKMEKDVDHKDNGKGFDKIAKAQFELGKKLRTEALTLIADAKQGITKANNAIKRAEHGDIIYKPRKELMEYKRQISLTLRAISFLNRASKSIIKTAIRGSLNSVKETDKK